MTKDLVKHNREVYDKIAPYFSATRQYLWDDLKSLSKYTRDGDRVLDLGCGNGRLYQLFHGLSIEYTGVDQSKGQIETARKKFPKNNFCIAEMTELPFCTQGASASGGENDSFDIIYCIATFHHLPDEKSRLKALQEMKRVLVPGGIIVMTNWNLYSDSVKKIVAKGKFKQENQEFMVPWLNSEGEVLGERYYYGFKLEELENLFKKSNLELQDQYFCHKGERAEVSASGNIISILKRKKK